MKAVFRVSNRIRAFAPIPRDFLPIPGLEHIGLCYKQRIIEDPVEFNDVMKEINDPRFPNRGSTIEAYMLTPEDESKLSATPSPIPSPEPEPPEEQPVQEEAPSVSPDKFRLEGSDIFMGDERVGGIYETGLRCSKGYADLRDEIEAWLNLNPE